MSESSRNVSIKNLPLNGIVYFHHGDNNIVYTRFNKVLATRSLQESNDTLLLPSVEVDVPLVYHQT